MNTTTAITFTAWKKIGFLCLCFGCVILLSCNQEKSKFENDIDTYLSESFEIETLNTQNASFIFLPLDTCKTCLNQTKEFLLNQPSNKNLHIILIAKTQREIENYSVGLKEKFTILKDIKGSIYSHPTLAQTLPLLMSKQQAKITILPFNINNNFEEMQQKVRSFYP
jgi:hypothetical protein